MDNTDIQPEDMYGHYNDEHGNSPRRKSRRASNSDPVEDPRNSAPHFSEPRVPRVDMTSKEFDEPYS